MRPAKRAELLEKLTIYPCGRYVRKEYTSDTEFYYTLFWKTLPFLAEMDSEGKIIAFAGDLTEIEKRNKVNSRLRYLASKHLKNQWGK